ncbi:MAG TPA: DUF1501 domain-containing protein [Stellaceae bacterium]|jgi:uncharacterized protein (DUF1501 family)
MTATTTRRIFLAALAASAATPAVPFDRMLGLGGAAFAAAPGDRRFVVVLLRGAMDGLAAVPPLGDARYAERRGALALAPASAVTAAGAGTQPGDGGGCLPLDGLFALHPALQPIHAYWTRGEMIVVPAAGNGYRTRSHFDAQDLMESGLARKTAQSDGWLNRALTAVQRGGGGDRRLGLAVGGAVPLILRGAVPVSSWEPPGMKPAAPEFMATLASLYKADPVLGPALAEGLRAQSLSAEVLGDENMRPGGRGFGPNSFRPLAEAAGRLLAAPDGPRIAALEMGGWDTHVNQGTLNGRLAQNLAGLADGLDALARSLGPAAWQETVVACVTEFGRTVAANGNGGTDHGTASVALLLGGALKGSRIAGDWPGLERLEENRDLSVATDTRAVLKGVLRDHLGLDAATLDHHVFPDAPALRPVGGLIRI